MDVIENKKNKNKTILSRKEKSINPAPAAKCSISYTTIYGAHFGRELHLKRKHYCEPYSVTPMGVTIPVEQNKKEKEKSTYVQ